MNARQKWISIAFALLLVLAAVCPPWQQTYKGERLPYAGDLGRHFFWQSPQATGEKSWMITAPPSQCEVSIDKDSLLSDCKFLIVLAALLFFTFRTRSRSSVMENDGTSVGVADWKIAGIAALILLCVATFVVFVIHPGGFEGQIGWFFVLLPGAFVFAEIANAFSKLAIVPFRVIQAFFIFGASLLWYFAISDIGIVIYRLSMLRLKRGHPPTQPQTDNLTKYQ